MANKSALMHVQVPNPVKLGEVITIQAKIQHPMDNGWPTNGMVVDAHLATPRNMLKSFRCLLNGVEVFAAIFSEGMAADPYLAFNMQVISNGWLVFKWEDETGTIFEIARELQVDLDA